MLRTLKAIGDLIHYYRIINGYSQQDLANKLNVTISAVSSWERGVSRPGIEIAYELSRDMNMTLDEFYTGQVAPNNRTYRLTDQISFLHAYLDIKKMAIDLEKNQLHITMNIYGIHVQKNTIDNHFSMTLESIDKIIKPNTVTIEEVDLDQKLASPELKEMHLRSKSYNIHTSFDYHPFEDAKCFIRYNQESATVELPGAVIELLTDGIPFDVYHPELSLKFLESNEFREGLQFITKTEGAKRLQAFMIYHYQYIMKFLKPHE